LSNRHRYHVEYLVDACVALHDVRWGVKPKNNRADYSRAAQSL
jgi:hypothetical protein